MILSLARTVRPRLHIADLPTGQLMLQMAQSLAWLHEAPEPFVVVIDRWIVVVPRMSARPPQL
jgi:hypothetical protein